MCVSVCVSVCLSVCLSVCHFPCTLARKMASVDTNIKVGLFVEYLFCDLAQAITIYLHLILSVLKVNLCS